MKIVSAIIGFLFANIFAASAQWSTIGNNVFNTNSGNVGVGLSSPIVKFQVNTPASDNDETLLKLGHRSNSIEVGTIIEIGPPDYSTTGVSRIVGYSNPHNIVYSKLALQTWNGTSWNNLIMDGLGNVGIGNSTPNSNAKLDVDGNIFTSGKMAIGITDMNKINPYSLAVNGTAIFTKAIVKSTSSWPDYVFTPTYNLPKLDSLEQFIKLNGHLPEVPKAEEVEKNGIDLGNNQALLLKKIEELTLIVIEQNKRIEKLEKEVKNK